MKITSEDKKPTLAWALLTFIVPISVFMYGFQILGLRPPLIPLLAAVAIAGCMSLCSGYSWKELQEGMFTSISRVHIAISILVMVGLIIAGWMASGTIPAIIYWGLKLINPQFFLVSALLLCCVASSATGTSLGTIGTLGVALLAVGQALGYPAPITVGAILSGAFFGDKMSPVSDSSNICAAVCEVPLFSLIMAMFWTTVPTLLLTIGVYLMLGMPYANASSSVESLNAILSGLETNFNLGPLAFVPPVLLVVLAYRRVPVLPVLFISFFSCVLIAVWNGVAFTGLLKMLTSGYVSSTGIKELDPLLSRGGMTSVMGTILMLMLCMSFGGILEKARVFEVLFENLTRNATSPFRLVLSTVLSGYVILLGTGNQSLAQVVTGRAFLTSYRREGLHPLVLSRTIEDSATIGTILIPWSVHSLFVGAVLGVSTLDYAPYAIFNWSIPLFTLLCAATGIGVWRADGTPLNKVLAYSGFAPDTGGEQAHAAAKNQEN